MLRILLQLTVWLIILSSPVTANHENGYSRAGNQQPAGQQSQVEIYDHGLQVPIYAYTLPPGWRLNQHIATDLNNVWRMYSHYVWDLFGPNGELITSLFPRAVYPSQGENWQQIWQQLFHEQVGRLGTFSFGQPIHSPLAEVLFPKSSRVPNVRIFERDVFGSLQGAQVEGKLFATVIDNGYSLLMYASAILCPKGFLPQTIQTLSQSTHHRSKTRSIKCELDNSWRNEPNTSKR